MKKMKILKILFFISILLILFSSYNLFIWFNDKNKNNQLQQELKGISNLDNTSSVNNETNINSIEKDSDFLQINFNELLEKNEDTVAWIKIDGTNIDYAVVQSNDNEYYLNHSFDKSSNKAGWIFSDFRNNLKYLNSNSVIYGHGRVDNTMFGSLRNFITDEWFKNSSDYIIKLSTPHENMIWEIFSIYTILNESYYITTHFDSSSSFQKFIDKITKRSLFIFPVNVTTDDKILTLSTCKNDYNERIVVHAKLLKKETLTE